MLDLYPRSVENSEHNEMERNNTVYVLKHIPWSYYRYQDVLLSVQKRRHQVVGITCIQAQTPVITAKLRCNLNVSID